MTPDNFLGKVIDPGLKILHHIGGPEQNDDVRRFLLCVALQESGPTLMARYQSSPAPEPGPARGWWQFEQAGVNGVMSHSASRTLASTVCDWLVVVPDTRAVWRSLEGSSLLAAMFARLLLLTDPYSVPTEADDAWDCYANRLWRPGAPHPETWSDNWATADATVKAHPFMSQSFF